MSGSLLIAGQWQEGRGEILESRDPVTREVVWSGRSADSSDVDAAVKAARDAFTHWASRTQFQRQEILEKFAKLVLERKTDLAELISREVGKPTWESFTEVQTVAAKIAISITAFEERCREVSKAQGVATSVTRYRPHGVVAVFGPFNFPGHLANGHIVPALLAGNTVVYKPSELAPATAELIVKIWQDAGLPAGVINLVQGGRVTGEAIVAHSDVDGIFFTGSERVGLSIAKSSAEHPEKILALELGGNNPLIVWDAQDAKAAALLTVQSAFATAGQRCTCARRLIVANDGRETEFLNELVALTKKIRVGHYLDRPEPYCGPVVTPQAAQNALDVQSGLFKKGAMSLLEMKQIKPSTGLLSPGLVDVTSVQEKSDREVFAPFLQITRVKDFSDAIIEANKTAYGLAAGLISDSRQLYDEFRAKIRAGIVNWNQQLTGASSAAPFGGVGRSGNHRPSAYFAADYCSYVVASLEVEKISLPTTLPIGIDA